MLSLFDYIRSVASLCNNKLIIFRDFNFPTINWNLNTSFSNLLCDIIFDLNLAQLVDKPTHKGGNIL